MMFAVEIDRSSVYSAWHQAVLIVQKLGSDSLCDPLRPCCLRLNHTCQPRVVAVLLMMIQ